MTSGAGDEAPRRRRLVLWSAYLAICGMILTGAALLLVQLLGLLSAMSSVEPAAFLVGAVTGAVLVRRTLFADPIYTVSAHPEFILLDTIPWKIRIRRADIVGFDWQTPGVPKIVARRRGGLLRLPLRPDQVTATSAWLVRPSGT